MTSPEIEKLVERAIRVSQLNAGERSATPQEVAENACILAIEACAEAVRAEKVDAEDSGHNEDITYNQAIDDAEEAIRRLLLDSAGGRTKP